MFPTYQFMLSIMQIKVISMFLFDNCNKYYDASIMLPYVRLRVYVWCTVNDEINKN